MLKFRVDNNSESKRQAAETTNKQAVYETAIPYQDGVDSSSLSECSPEDVKAIEDTTIPSAIEKTVTTISAVTIVSATTEVPSAGAAPTDKIEPSATVEAPVMVEVPITVVPSFGIVPPVTEMPSPTVKALATIEPSATVVTLATAIPPTTLTTLATEVTPATVVPPTTVVPLATIVPSATEVTLATVVTPATEVTPGTIALPATVVPLATAVPAATEAPVTTVVTAAALEPSATVETAGTVGSPQPEPAEPGDEVKLHQAVVGLVPTASHVVQKRKWSIPQSDSEDETNGERVETSRNAHRFSLTMGGGSSQHGFHIASESEEEDPYAMATSPTMSIKSAEPPIPPPVSTIPRNYSAKQATENIEPVHESNSPEIRRKVVVNASVGLKKRSIVSTSDTDPYDEIDYSDADKHEQQKVVEGQSEPRFLFTLSKSRARLNPGTKTTDDTYAEIPKKIAWNFPSSSDEDEPQTEIKRPKKFNQAKANAIRHDSDTSDEEDRPMPPPKLWEFANPEENLEGAQHSNSSGTEEVETQAYNHQDITVEYSALQRAPPIRRGSLQGADDGHALDEISQYSTSEFEANDNADALSVGSDTSSKIISDYEQSSTCVDMDQLSLDSGGTKPKRIVETHETHEIVPADNNEDDIVERIIETQTITEKIEENQAFKDSGNDEFPKYLENDDEFVSHIFTLGRTLEKQAVKKRPKDFAFVENPFSVPDPVIETLPLEKKTVKQKITTLVKKRKARDDDNIYAEVKMEGEEQEPEEVLTPEGEHYDVMGAPPRWATNQAEPSYGQSSKQEGSNELYQLVDESNDFSRHPISDKLKDTKPEKKSLLKGIKKLLKKKEKSTDTYKVDPSVLEDDYQEYVP